MTYIIHNAIYRSTAKTALYPIVTQFHYFRKDIEIHTTNILYASLAHACTYVAHTRSPHLYDVYKNNLIRISLPLIHNVILAENVGQNNPDLKGRAAGIQIMPFVEGLINCNLSAVVYIYIYIHFILTKSVRFDIRYSQSSILIGFSLNTVLYVCV